jgi:adenine-specific DNA-methyltransferase
MKYNKLLPEIFNDEEDKLAKLAALFPAAVKDGAVDFTALREELGEFEEVTAERYELTWAGKQAAKKLAQTDVPGRTLKFIPEDSRDADTTQNLYIEGDNLEVLKLLRKNYYGAVKMIYVDPPYNTGNDFVYRDNFTQTAAESDKAEGETIDGERMVVNQKSGNRYHANWLNMMYPRLRIAKDLLRDDGVIFISIDDNEVENLKKLCNEVFGEDNFVAELVWKRKRGRDNSARWFSKAHEYLLLYAKNKDNFDTNYLELDDETKQAYKNPDNDPRGIWRMPLVGQEVRKAVCRMILQQSQGNIFLNGYGCLVNKTLRTLMPMTNLSYEEITFIEKCSLLKTAGKFPKHYGIMFQTLQMRLMK